MSEVKLGWFAAVVGVASLLLLGTMLHRHARPTDDSSRLPHAIHNSDGEAASVSPRQVEAEASSLPAAPFAVPLDATSGTFEARLRRLEPGEREAVERFAATYPDALSAFNEAQMAWAVRAGIPTPEQIAAADQLSTQSLEAMAEQGDAMAVLFSADRWLNEIEAVLPPAGQRLASMRRTDLDALTAAQRAADRLRNRSCSAMAPHIELRAMRLIGGGLSPAAEASALSRIVAYGDPRVGQRLVDSLLAMGVPPTGNALREVRSALDESARASIARVPHCPHPQPMPD